MKINEKIKIMILLFLIITLNTYIGCKREEKEGFIKGIVTGVLEIIPIEPIKDFLQEDVKKGGGGFEVLLVLAFSIFKLIILIGVMPFVMLFVMKAAVIAGMMKVTSGMFSFLKWFTAGSAASGGAPSGGAPGGGAPGGGPPSPANMAALAADPTGGALNQ